jgi:hypothetical protein
MVASTVIVVLIDFIFETRIIIGTDPWIFIIVNVIVGIIRIVIIILTASVV